MDVFSEVLQSARIGGAAIGKAKLASPWGISVDPAKNPTIHVIQRGLCFLTFSSNQAPIQLGQGDLILVASGVGHSLSNPPDAPIGTLSRAFLQNTAADDANETGDSTTFLCAKYTLDEVKPHPLVSLMPPFIHFTRRQIEADIPLRLAIELLTVESTSEESGYELVASRLLDSVLVLLLRAWMKSQPLGAGGWLGALRDKGVTRALQLIHERPAYPWTVDSLADGALQSRATFARRFNQLVGEPPLSYVKKWRMNLAARALRDTKDTIEQIGLAVGYHSAPSFTQAFTKCIGQSPSTYRRARASIELR